MNDSKVDTLVLWAIHWLGTPNAYGMTIRKQLEQFNISHAALYSALDRLEAQGMIKTWQGDPTPERGGSSEHGGRPKRFARITEKANELRKRKES